MTPVDVEQVKRRNPIVEVIASHGVQLRPNGGRLGGRCPFHEDRSPSLVIYPETRSFYCFGCGAGGDVIDFVRRAEGLGFREAVELLADGNGRPIQPATAPKPAAKPRRLSLDDRLILSAACELYHETLLRQPAALRYLDERGVPSWLARQCRLGFSDGRQLVRYLKRRRLSLRRARELGLLFRSNDETMASRLVIPELRGAHCAWMVGRAIDDDHAPKYRGLSLPKPLLGYERVRGRRRVFVVEGPFDWLTLTGWGLPACALLGTQAGHGALRLLDRARSIVFVMDNDGPGRDAAERLAHELGDRAETVQLPPGINDVAELGALPDGRGTFFRLLDGGGRDRDAASSR